MILANTDATSSVVFQPVCEDPRLEVMSIAFTGTLTRARGFWRGVFDVFRMAGGPYFAYLVFQNAVFRAKELILLVLPFMRVFFPRFFSLRIWARRNGVEVITSYDFNSEGFIARVRGRGPDVLLTRINQLLRRPILVAAPHGCWCFHSSALPKYRGIAAEFHSLLNGETHIGFTVMQMEPKLDAGPIIAQAEFPVPPGVSLHGLITYGNRQAQKVVREAIDALVSNSVRHVPQGPAAGHCYSWPSSEEAREFRRKGHRYVTLGEIIDYAFR